MASTPTLSDALYALKIATGKQPFDAKYDVNGDGTVDTTDYIGLQKAYLGKDPGFAFASDAFISPASKTPDEYAALEKANQERIAAQEQENARRQTLLADAQKIYGNVTPELVANNPNLTAQQLASLATQNYWSNESEAFSRVMTGMQNGTAQLKQVIAGYDEGNQPIMQLAITTGEHPGYDTLYLKETPTPGVYQFSTPNQVAGGTITGVIQADPNTGKYVPIQDYTKQVAYTPGQSGSFLGGLAGTFGDLYKSLGPVGTIIGNALAPGLGTALSTVAAIDEGNLGSVAKGLLAAEGLNQLGVGSTIADVTGSQAAGTVGESLAKGLLSGQSLDTALTNAVVNNLNTLVGPPESPVTVTKETPVPSVVADVFKGSDVEDLVSGMDLTSDSVLGSSIDDVIKVLTQDTVPSVKAEDTIVGTTGEDTVVSGQDLTADSIIGSTLDDVIKKLTEDTIVGTTGEDSVSGGEATTQGGTGTDTIVATGGEDTIVGTTGEDTTVGTKGEDTVTATTGTDVIDTVTGVSGEDTLVSGQDLAADKINNNTLDEIINVLTDDTTVSGQDLSADTTAGSANSLEDISKALAGEGDLISGQDLSADAGAGNTLEDVSKALAADYTATTEDTQKQAEVPGLTNAQLLNLLRLGTGLFGTTGALSKVLKPSTTPSTAPVTPPEQPIPPFTGTYSGINLNSPEYYQQVQQNYNRLFPGSNINVAEPLQQWYDTKFTPVTTKLFGV